MKNRARALLSRGGLLKNGVRTVISHGGLLKNGGRGHCCVLISWGLIEEWGTVINYYLVGVVILIRSNEMYVWVGLLVRQLELEPWFHSWYKALP